MNSFNIQIDPCKMQATVLTFYKVGFHHEPGVLMLDQVLLSATVHFGILVWGMCPGTSLGHAILCQDRGVSIL